MPIVTSPTDDTRSLADRFRSLTDVWSRSLVRIVEVAAAFADSTEWVVAGSPTAAHHLAEIASVDVATVREWIRIGRQLRTLPASATAFATGEISYSKLRTLSRIATPDNERDLLEIARAVPAGDLGRALAAWMGRTCDPEELDAHQQRRRAIRERVEPDGMTTVTMSRPPFVAGAWSAAPTTIVMRTTRRPARASADAWPTLAQQKVDALHTLLTDPRFRRRADRARLVRPGADPRCRSAPRQRLRSATSPHEPSEAGRQGARARVSRLRTHRPPRDRGVRPQRYRSTSASSCRARTLPARPDGDDRRPEASVARHPSI